MTSSLLFCPKALPEKGTSIKERNLLLREAFVFPFRIDSFSEGKPKHFGGVAFPEVVTIHLNGLDQNRCLHVTYNRFSS